MSRPARRTAQNYHAVYAFSRTFLFKMRTQWIHPWYGVFFPHPSTTVYKTIIIFCVNYRTLFIHSGSFVSLLLVRWWCLARNMVPPDENPLDELMVFSINIFNVSTSSARFSVRSRNRSLCLYFNVCSITKFSNTSVNRNQIFDNFKRIFHINIKL